MGVFAPQRVSFFLFFISLIISSLRLQKLAEYELPCGLLIFCHNVVMKIEKDLSHIAEAIAKANANGNAVPSQFAGLVEDLKAEQLAEKLVVEHGLLEASDEDIKEEFVSLDAVEADKEDIDEDDEEQTDMDCVSGSFADLFDTIED